MTWWLRNAAAARFSACRALGDCAVRVLFSVRARPVSVSSTWSCRNPLKRKSCARSWQKMLASQLSAQPPAPLRRRKEDDTFYELICTPQPDVIASCRENRDTGQNEIKTCNQSVSSPSLIETARKVGVLDCDRQGEKHQQTTGAPGTSSSCLA